MKIALTQVYRGYKYYVVEMDGWRNGYVVIPLHNVLYGKEYNDNELECHGGLTYAGTGGWTNDDPENDEWWIGFDCHHLGDTEDESLYSPETREYRKRNRFNLWDSEEGFVKTQEYVVKQCESLIDQIHDKYASFDDIITDARLIRKGELNGIDKSAE